MKHAHAATLGSGNLRNAVALPDGEDLNEWVAVNSKCVCDINLTRLEYNRIRNVDQLKQRSQLDKFYAILIVLDSFPGCFYSVKNNWVFWVSNGNIIIACLAVDFFNQINMLYGTITEFCTEDSCSIMSAGPKYEYHWADGQTVKKPIKCSAPKYIDYLMTWVQDQLDDETLFPSKIGVPFPKNFLTIAKTILKRLFRVYAHIYHQHFQEVVRLGEEAHLNTSFKHFIYFVQEFNLIDRRELAPLQELIEKLTGKDDRSI